MRPQKQKFAHKPEEGIFGDCFRTAIAAILDLDRDDVPHFNEGAFYDDGKQVDRARAWLKGRGLNMISLAYPGETPLDDLIGTIGRLNPGIPFLLAGRSAAGCNHQVVASGTGIVCDPSGTGITGPCNDGLYWVDFIGADISDAITSAPEAP